jgi:hypothetical protein
VYFTSEKEARRAEAEPMPEEVRQQMEELMAELGEPTYFDLPEPIIVS